MSLVRLDTVCKINNGYAFKSEDYKNEGIPLLRISNFNNGEVFIDDKTIYVDKKYLNSKADFIVEKGDILIALSGATTGKFGIYNYDYPSLLNQRIGLLKSGKSEKMFGKFFYHYLSILKDEILRKAGGAAQPNISTKTIGEFQIPLPPLATQQKIAAILDAADELRQKDKALVAKYDELTQALFLDMFGDPVTNPKGWEISDLGELTHMITDGKHGNCNDETDSGYYFISAKDIFDENINYQGTRQIPKIEFEEVDRRTNLQPGDLVMVNTGATIGKLAIVRDQPETRRTTFQKSVAVIKPKEEKILSQYLKYVFILRLNSFSGKGTGSAIQNLLLSEMRRFRITTPPIKLQDQFAERVKAIEEQKSIAQASALKSEELFNSLLQKAFTGELV